MWCLNPDCGFLDQAEPKRHGVGPWACPACSKETYENALEASLTSGATATTTATVTLSVSISVWSAWARIAIRAARQAAKARNKYDSAPPGRGADFVGLEFESGLTAIAAVAFALDGFYACEAVPQAARNAAVSSLTTQANPNPDRHEKVREALKLCFVVNGATAQTWSKEIKWVYSRRNPIVHSKDEWETPIEMPDGALSTVKRQNYNAEAAARAVDAMLGVLTYCVAHPGTAYPQTATWADPNRRAGIDNLDRWWRTPGWHPFDGMDDT